MKKFVLLILVYFLASPSVALGELDRIDIVGLIPGVSTRLDVKNAFRYVETQEKRAELFDFGNGYPDDEYLYDLGRLYPPITNLNTNVIPGSLHVGGLSLTCISDFIEDKLSELNCHIRKARDATTEKTRILSHEKVYITLLEGFSNKFGKPQISTTNVLTNQLGAEFNQIISIWIDSEGNSFTIINIVNEIDKGILSVKSSELIAKETREEKESDKARKF